MRANLEIINFVQNNWVLIVLIIVSIMRIVPPEWAGFWKYNGDNEEAKGRAPRITVANFILTSIFDSVIRSFFIPLLATLGLKNTVTLIVLIVVPYDIFVRKQISGPAVTLVCVGIIALYLERLIETGKRISLFGLLIWEKSDTSQNGTPGKS